MIFDKYWKLRLKKFFTSRLHKWAFKGIPFGIGYCDIADTYDNYPPKEILAEFDFKEKNRHYIIFKE